MFDELCWTLYVQLFDYISYSISKLSNINTMNIGNVHFHFRLIIDNSTWSCSESFTHLYINWSFNAGSACIYSIKMITFVPRLFSISHVWIRFVSSRSVYLPNKKNFSCYRDILVWFLVWFHNTSGLFEPYGFKNIYNEFYFQ